MSLNVSLVPGPDRVVVRFTGEADLATSPVISEALGRAAALGTPQVVVDVATTKFWDVSGLHALVDFTGELSAADRSCRIVGAAADTRRLIALAGFAGDLELDGATPALPWGSVRPPRPGPPARRPVGGRAAPAGGGQPPVTAGRLPHRDQY
jgi:anti-anti-sigma factor